MALLPQVTASLDALLPLIVLDDDELHATTSLPEAIYHSPAHLDYVCTQLAATMPRGSANESSKWARLRVIDRRMRLCHMPFSRFRRCRGAGGPNATMMWRIEHVDPMVRMAASSIAWSLEGDERRIKRRFYELVERAVEDTDGMLWWCGDGDSVHCGRFFPIPKTQAQLGAILARLGDRLRQVGFELTIKEDT